MQCVNGAKCLEGVKCVKGVQCAKGATDRDVSDRDAANINCIVDAEHDV